MKTLAHIKRNTLRKIFGFLSFSAALFIFEACYGMPADYMENTILLKGTVKSKNTGQPAKGIDVWTQGETVILGSSDENGEFSAEIWAYDCIDLAFIDPDSLTNKLFASKDTTISFSPEADTVQIEVLLDEIAEGK